MIIVGGWGGTLRKVVLIAPDRYGQRAVRFTDGFYVLKLFGGVW